MNIKAKQIVWVRFPGAHLAKERPAIVVSSDEYHRTRFDCVLGLVTSRLDQATAPTDHILQDWRAAGLARPSAFRAFFYTCPRSLLIRQVGEVSDADWQAVQLCLQRCFDL